MPTPKKGARLGGSASHQQHMLANLAQSLFEHGAIKTTDAKAKMLRPYAEKLITKAKKGSVADRRAVAAQLPSKEIAAYLCNELAPQFENREGGYTRSIKLPNRSGDNAPMTQISLVLEETVSSEATRAARAAASKQAAEPERTVTETEDEVIVEETVVEETDEPGVTEEIVEVEEVPADEESQLDAPAADAEVDEKVEEIEAEDK
ncbi:50S ribosomal protein L17 [Corynebacterium sp. Marseille-P4321]|uniref:50S ribosomal protein L17 n=1 Tax=Corynebacterium sp. Marseille-P4321 TaxID=2736603 RepID=UPI00089354F0|nr:50S ribosomal protein L17 [Corynebacterium sp. Marseille-P4321]OEX94419.1 50S ribosomal protein L17 [Corynebacterium sp. BCW_4722]